jgi:hypothetical protein
MAVVCASEDDAHPPSSTPLPPIAPGDPVQRLWARILIRFYKNLPGCGRDLHPPLAAVVVSKGQVCVRAILSKRARIKMRAQSRCTHTHTLTAHTAYSSQLQLSITQLTAPKDRAFLSQLSTPPSHSNSNGRGAVLVACRPRRS